MKGVQPATARQPDAHQPGARSAHIRGVLLVVLLLNVGVATAKFAWGTLSGSVAMTADGLQSFLDAAANVVGLVGIAIAARPPDEDHLYGHERYETLASLVISALMVVGVIEILQRAISQLQGGESPDVTAGSFVVMGVTIAVNLGVTTWERIQGRRLKSDFLIADAKHTMSDVLVSLGVIAGLVAVGWGLTGADAVISILIALVIAWAAWTILRDASLVLTDAVRSDPRQLMAAVLRTDDVVTAHQLRARSSGGRSLVEVHVTVNPDMRVAEAHDVASAVEENIREVAGSDAHVSVHVEPAEYPHTRPDLLFGDVDPDPGELPGASR